VSTEHDKLKDLVNQFLYEHDELWVEDDPVFDELAEMTGWFEYDRKRQEEELA
jgi:hypothetical protein